MSKKKVLVADESTFMRKIVSETLNTHPELEVISLARTGKEVLTKVKFMFPDIIVMDLDLPTVSSLEVIDQIMKTNPIPIIVLTSPTKKAQKDTLQSIKRGAVDFIAKPSGPISLNLQEFQTLLLQKVLQFSQGQNKEFALKGRKKIKKEVKSSILNEKESRKSKNISKMSETFVIIGTSTGGPRALQEVLTRLPKDFPAPVLIVQHMPRGFTKSLAERLDKQCQIQVKEANHGEKIEKGIAYIAPGGQHLKFRKQGKHYYIQLDRTEAPRKAHRPSVDVLFETCVKHPELQYITVIMTGMGSDGCEGMQLLRQQVPNVITIAESMNTAVIYGMPKAIIERELVDHIVDLSNIASTLEQLLKF